MQLQGRKVAAADVAIPNVAGGRAATQDRHPTMQRGIQRCRKAYSDAEWKQEVQKGIQQCREVSRVLGASMWRGNLQYREVSSRAE
jgi:hypothetical protein